MAALFPRWTNTAIRLGVAAAAFSGAAAIAGPMIYVRSPLRRGQLDPIDQPVQFDHRHHVRDNGMDCRYCHSTVDKSAFAGVPPTEKCLGCHNQVWPSSAELEPVRASFFTNTPIQWNRVHHLPDYVYFNHSAHVNHGVGCVSCHGRVDGMARVYQVEPLTMGWCLDCHRNPEPKLRPLDQITSMTWEPEGDPEVQGHALAEKYGTRKLTHCSACHR